MKRKIIRKTIKITLCVFCSALCAFLFTFAVTAARMQRAFDDELYGNVVRLHILANSDSAEDQKAKTEIRDGVLSYIDGITKSAAGAGEAAGLISSNLSNIEEYTKKVIEELGYSYDVSVKFSDEYYPVRYYDSFSFPAGHYRSLRIVLGAGEGKNWWCVLYPSVCTSMSSQTKEKLEEAGISSDTADILCSDKKQVKFGMYFLELLKK